MGFIVHQSGWGEKKRTRKTETHLKIVEKKTNSETELSFLTQRNLTTQGQKKEMKYAEVSNPFISLKQMSVIYQLTSHPGWIPFKALYHSFLFSQFFSLPLLQSVLLEAALPIYIESFFSSIFPFFFYLHFPSWSLVHGFLQPSPSSRPLSVFPLFQAFSHVFFHYCHGILSWHFRTEALCLREKMSQLCTPCSGLCGSRTALFLNVCRAFILMKHSNAFWHFPWIHIVQCTCNRQL